MWPREALDDVGGGGRLVGADDLAQVLGVEPGGRRSSPRGRRTSPSAGAALPGRCPQTPARRRGRAAGRRVVGCARARSTVGGEAGMGSALQTRPCPCSSRTSRLKESSSRAASRNAWSPLKMCASARLGHAALALQNRDEGRQRCVHPRPGASGADPVGAPADAAEPRGDVRHWPRRILRAGRPPDRIRRRS